jgi:hypothetical protein
MDNNEPTVIQELQAIAQEKVPDEDYQQQVDRWNRYQATLDKVARSAQLSDFRFFRIACR